VDHGAGPRDHGHLRRDALAHGADELGSLLRGQGHRLPRRACDEDGPHPALDQLGDERGRRGRVERAGVVEQRGLHLSAVSVRKRCRCPTRLWCWRSLTPSSSGGALLRH